jgi:hypothetical protein
MGLVVARGGRLAPRLLAAWAWALTLALTACAPATSSAASARQVNHSASAVSQPSVTPPPDTFPRPLPAFSDWRATYIGADGRLHAVSLGGALDDVGSLLPIAGYTGDGVFTPGTASGGASLAYFSDARLTLVNVDSGELHTYPVHTGDSLLTWSPDGRSLALNDAGEVIAVTVASGASATEPPRQGAAPGIAVSAPYGWLDTTHVAVADLLASTDTRAELASLDVTSGALRPIATLKVDPGASFSVAPGGKSVLFWSAKFRGDSYTPQAALIDSASGKVTSLPKITGALTTYGFLTLLWRPGSTQALAATIQPGASNLSFMLLDVAHDTVRPLKLPGFPEAWSPDGATLLLATNGKAPITEDAPGFNDIGALGAGPFTLSAVAVDAKGNTGQPITLTTQAMTIPTLGFVRTA